MKNDNEKREAAIEQLAIDAFVRDSNWPVDLWATHLGDTQREFWRGQVAPAYDAGREDAAKAEPLTIDREALREVEIAKVIHNATCGPDPHPECHSDNPRREDEVAARAVIAHLSAQEAATEVEWGTASLEAPGEWTAQGPEESRSGAEFEVARSRGDLILVRRTVTRTAWQEAPADV